MGNNSRPIIHSVLFILNSMYIVYFRDKLLLQEQVPRLEK